MARASRYRRRQAVEVRNQKDNKAPLSVADSRVGNARILSNWSFLVCPDVRVILEAGCSDEQMLALGGWTPWPTDTHGMPILGHPLTTLPLAMPAYSWYRTLSSDGVGRVNLSLDLFDGAGILVWSPIPPVPLALHALKRHCPIGQAGAPLRERVHI